MEIWTDGGTQGRGLLEEEDPQKVFLFTDARRAAAQLIKVQLVAKATC